MRPCRFFLESAPLPTRGASPKPLRVAMATFLTDIYTLFGHDKIIVSFATLQKMSSFKASISIALVFLIGLLLERALRRYLQAFGKKRGLKGVEVLSHSLKVHVTLWSLCVGFFLALPKLPLSQEGFLLLRKAVLSLLIVSLSLFFSGVLARTFGLYLERFKEVLPPTSLFENLIRVFVLVIGFLILVQALGLSITPALAGLGIGGLAAALALQGPLANLFSGIHIMLSRQIRPGDYVKLETGHEGYVVDISWRNTTIRELPNNLVIVPNAKLASLIVVNYHQPEPQISVIVPVQVSYSSDLEKVERVTLEVAQEVMREVPGGVVEFEPLLRFQAFEDSGIRFNVILRAREYSDQYIVRHEFIKRLLNRYRQEGIEIPYPTRTVHLKRKGEPDEGGVY